MQICYWKFPVPWICWDLAYSPLALLSGPLPFRRRHPSARWSTLPEPRLILAVALSHDYPWFFEGTRCGLELNLCALKNSLCFFEELNSKFQRLISCLKGLFLCSYVQFLLGKSDVFSF